MFSQEEHWENYIASYDNNMSGSTTVRMDLINFAPIPNYQYVLVTGITYESAREDGFPKSEETFKLVQNVGDDLIKLLDKNYSFIHVGSFMFNFERLEYFYLKSTDGLNELLENFYKSNYPNNKYYINIKKDLEWEYYTDFLYPNDDTLNYISDQKVVNQLIENGDKLTKERRIDHWIYFSNSDNMKQFKVEVEKIGFTIEYSGKNDQTDLPFEIRIYRIDKVDIDSIFPITNRLRKLAKEYNGDYDGWETSVEID